MQTPLLIEGLKEFRGELEARFPGRKFSFIDDRVVATATVASANQPERLRPEYPIAAWEGTAVAEFSKLCANDNNIPRKMYAEAFRCALGAIVGDRLSCDGVEGALPRTYTVIVAKGKGKGTAIRRAVRGSSIRPGVVQGCPSPPDCYQESVTSFGNRRA